MNKRFSNFIKTTGEYIILIGDVFSDIFRHGVNKKELSKQIISIGASSLPIVLLTALFTGMVLALQTAYGLQRFGAKNYVGNIAGLAFVRELGPVLTTLVMAGRVGAGIAAEIASMVVTEQVDAMRALGANPISKLVTPRVVAGIIATPLLVVFANCLGIYGGLLITVFELNLSAHIYFSSLLYTLKIRDLTDGLIKSGVFGLLVVTIACYKGLKARGGTEGVGTTTTAAVVYSSIAIFFADFLLTKLLLLI